MRYGEEIYPNQYFVFQLPTDNQLQESMRNYYEILGK